MSACPDKLPLISALLDDELDAANARDLEQHLKTCPGCAGEFAALQSLREHLAEADLAEPAPKRLHAAVEAMIEAEVAPKRRTGRVWPLAGLGGFAAGAAASVAALTLLPAAPMLEAQLVDDHVRSTLGAHLVDVETSDRHTVKPWFNGKIDFAPPVVDLAPQGFPLVGGRVDYLQGRVVAALVYRRNKHVINVFIRPEHGGLSLPPGRSRDGYNLVRWSEGGLEFWAVSDVERGELEALKREFMAATKS
jgi:anti-sigma factor RsiW